MQNTEDLSSLLLGACGADGGYDDEAHLSLGDWADRSQIPKEATMPLHYSAARYQHSIRIKHIVRLAMEKLLAYESWETVPEQVHVEAVEFARKGVGKVLQQEW